MKKWLVILTLVILPGFAFAQEDEDTQDGGKIPERMRVFIQDRLGLTKRESERFAPIFLRYFREFVQTHRQFRQDKLILQQKIVDLRLRYRVEFRQIMDEPRANKVYFYEDQFRREVVKMIKENRMERRGGRRFR